MGFSLVLYKCEENTVYFNTHHTIMIRCVASNHNAFVERVEYNTVGKTEIPKQRRNFNKRTVSNDVWRQYPQILKHNH